MFLKRTAVIFILFQIILVRGYDYNVSFAEVSSCKEYIIDSNYKYEKLFKVEHLNEHKNEFNRDLLLHLKFYVLAAKDVHILLSTTDTIKFYNRVYEIIIGAGENKFSVIGQRLGKSTVVRKNSTNVLSAIHITPIEIQQSIDGVLKILIKGHSEQPFLEYADSNPLKINYVGFSTYRKTPARWWYDCKVNEEEAMDEIKIANEGLNLTDKLTKDLLSNYSVYDSPQLSVPVNISFYINSLKFDHHLQELHTRIDLIVQWSDDRLSWNEDNYENMTSLTSSDLKIWKPSLHIVNGSYRKPQNNFMFVYSDGTVVDVFENIEIKSWCSQDPSNWPHDQTNCRILTGYDFSHIELQMKSLSQNNGSSHGFRWIFKGITEQLIDYSEQDSRAQQIFAIKLFIKRDGLCYKMIFYTPTIFTTLMILLSFAFKSPHKTAINGIAMLISCISLISLIDHVPSFYVPMIAKIIEINFWLSTCNTLIIIGILRLKHSPPKSTPFWLFGIINFTPIRWLVAASYINSAHYLSAQKYPWTELSRLVGRINFMITLLIFFYFSFLLI